jgi:hypothetical protein
MEDIESPGSDVALALKIISGLRGAAPKIGGSVIITSKRLALAPSSTRLALNVSTLNGICLNSFSFIY